MRLQEDLTRGMLRLWLSGRGAMPSDTTCLLLAQSVPLHFYLTTVPDSQTRKQQADSSCSYQIGHPTRRRTEVCGCFPRAGGQAEAPSLLHVSG